MSVGELPRWRYVMRRTVALAVIVAVVLWIGTEILDFVGVDMCAEDFGCLPETR